MFALGKKSCVYIDKKNLKRLIITSTILLYSYIQWTYIYYKGYLTQKLEEFYFVNFNVQNKKEENCYFEAKILLNSFI